MFYKRKSLSLQFLIPCRICAGLMTHAGIIPQSYGVPAMHRFECDACGAVCSIEVRAVA